jgi:hopanoid biosynthesis associated RND transporter like protein HpnN
MREVAAAGGLSLLLVTVVLYYSLRSIRLVFATVLTLLVGLAWTAGFAAVAVGQLNALTSAFAVIYIGLGVDFGIHFALGFLDRRDHDETAASALRTTGQRVGGALFLCAITTAIGFYSFVPTDYTAVADMGIISGSSVFLGLLATLTLFPALIAHGLGDSSNAPSALLERIEIKPPTFPIRYPRAVCAVAAVLSLVCGAAAFSVRFEFSTLKVRDPRVESVQALEDLLLDPELSVWTVDVITADIDEATKLAAELEQLEGVEQVLHPQGFVPEDQEERLAIFEKMRTDLVSPIEVSDEESGADLDRLQAVEYTAVGYGVALDLDEELRGGAPEGDTLWDAAQELRTALDVMVQRIQDDALTVEQIDVLEADVFGDLADVVEDMIEALPTRSVTLADLPSDLMSRYIAKDGRVRVEIYSVDNLNDRGALERFNDLIQTRRPMAGGPVAGAVELGRTMISALRQALVTAVVVIALGLVLLWRSVKYTLFTLAPLVVGGLGTAAVSVAADIPFNFANVIVLPLILGIGVDSGIHLVHRHRSGLEDATDLLSTPTARAVLFSALTTLISFGTLAISNHLGISSLAKLLCVGVGLMLAANVIVLPALLEWLDTPQKPPPPADRR